MKRMDREQFFGQLAKLDEERLKKALWNLYWRGSATIRERIESEVGPDQPDRRNRSKDSVDPEGVLSEVADFITLARSGAYLGGDRRVSPRERTRWRFTFKRLVTDAQSALHAEDSGPGASAVEQLLDLACETKDYEYFRSDDPIEAAHFVMSDTVALLWAKLHDQYGFAGFAERAAPQFVRWESRHGWTRGGWGRVSEKKTSLALVLARMLPVSDTWIGFADRYLESLDQVSRDGTGRRSHGRTPSRDREQRTEDLAEWHLLLLDRLVDTEAEDRLDRLMDHPALGGPELTFLSARLAHYRGDLSRAHDLVYRSLDKLPGHQNFLDFAMEIGAPLPSHAERIAAKRRITTSAEA